MQQISSTSSSTLNNGTHAMGSSSSYDPASKAGMIRMTAQEPTSGPPSMKEPSNLSTMELESKLQSLRGQSNKLSQELTQRLATSESGQNLMQIGPSLSTLPPDLHSLITCVQPLLSDVEEYEETNTKELDRLHQYQEIIDSSSARARHARHCVALFEDLCAGERDVKRDVALQKKESFSAGGLSDGVLDDNKDDGCSEFAINNHCDELRLLQIAFSLSFHYTSLVVSFLATIPYRFSGARGILGTSSIHNAKSITRTGKKHSAVISSDCNQNNSTTLFM